ncbi:MAG: hypothetical protein AAFS10_21435, partial [Myxococcota bacterium]
GSSALVLGGDDHRVTMTLDEATVETLTGRRIAMRLWYRPAGTRATARAVWLSGSVSGQLKRGEPNFLVHTMGQIVLQPTGRATTDGWIELGSGPVDFEVGARLPLAYLAIEDANTADDGIEGIVSRDPEARVYVDAFSIEDLGPALIPDARCTPRTEAQVCSEHGLCHLGRCTDAAIYFGAAPQDPELRADYLARRRFEVEHFNGVRIATDNLSSFEDRLHAADSPNANLFWTEMIHAVNGLVDGHSTTPSARATSSIVAGGACTYIARADLMPGAPEAPIVFESFDRVPYGTQMKPGDVVVAIDSLEPMEFAALLDREIDYGGDPSASAEIFAPQLLGWAAQTGASWEIERCERPEGCGPDDVQRITIDPYPELAEPIWQGAPPSWRFVVPLCDYRVERLEDADEERAYGFADSKPIDDDVQLVLFNGFPRADTGDGQSGWFVTLSEVMELQPQRVLLDQRWGTGGFPDALQGLTDLLLAADDPPLLGETLPSGLVPTGEDRRTLQQRCDGRNCGMYSLFGQTPRTDGPAAQTRIALLNGYNVSANDFFARRMSVRPGRTRIFGHAPTFGAFGFACQLPPHLPGEAKLGYQCTDTVFSTNPEAPSTTFESGTGVAPDEVVRQLQSDLLSGVDTMRARALEWLREENP